MMRFLSLIWLLAFKKNLGVFLTLLFWLPYKFLARNRTTIGAKAIYRLKHHFFISTRFCFGPKYTGEDYRKIRIGLYFLKNNMVNIINSVVFN